MKQKLLLALFALLTAPTARAYDAEINGIYYNFSGNEATVTSGSTKYSGSVVIPESVTFNDQTYSVTCIGERAFYGCGDLTSVTISSGVTSIGNYAFTNCFLMASINIPSSVTSIGERAFNQCSLTKVIVPDIAAWCGISFGDITANPLYNGSHIFSDEETEIKDLIIPDGVTSISNYAFYYCKSLTSVTIPNTVTSICESAFGYCSGLTSITIGNGLTSIGDRAFESCRGLTSVTLPNCVTSIGESAFHACGGLTSVTIPNSVIGIGYQSFAYCTGLISFTIPNSVTTIGAYAFENCYFAGSSFVNNSSLTDDNYWGAIICDEETTDGLLIKDNTVVKCRSWATSVIIPEGVTSIGEKAFSGCSSLNSVTIPESVTSIGNYAFSGCSSLNSVTIPEGVTSIGENTFNGCGGLTSVTIPNSVTSIGKSAFGNCRKLTDVYCYSENVPSTGSNVFRGVPIATATLHVPAGSVDSYKATDPWSGFGNIVALGGGATGDLNGDNKVDIADAVSILDLMAEGSDNPAADLNGDGKVDIADFVSVLNLMAGQ